MKKPRQIWALAGRLLLCGFLLLWIFNTIFANEGRIAWRQKGLPWEALPWLEQVKFAWSYGPQSLWDTLKLVDVPEFATSLIFMGLTLVLGAFRWRMVLEVQGLRLPLGRTLEISMIAQFFNAFLLGSTGGDLLKAYYAARETHHKKTEAVVTVLVDRLLGLFSMLLFACLMILPNWALVSAYERLSGLSLLVLAMLTGCSLLVVLAFWGGVSQRFPKVRTWLRRLPKAATLERSLEACREFGRHRGFLLRSLALSMLLNVACVLQVMTIVSGLDLHIKPVVLFLVVPMVICISALPITPSGLGVRENLFVWILGVPLIHVDATKALSLSLLTYAGFLFWSVLGGVVYLTLRQSQHLDEVAREAESPAETIPS